MRILLRIAAFGVAVGAALALADWVARFIAIDQCLDNGGWWDYDAQTCQAVPPAPGFVSSQL